MEEAGFAQPGLAHHAHDLAMAYLCLLERPLQLVQFALATDKACEPASHGDLEFGALRADAQDFIDVERLFDPFDGRGAQALKLKEAVRQFMGILGNYN